jgi:GNAT acetyltransferase-like protein
MIVPSPVGISLDTGRSLPHNRQLTHEVLDTAAAVLREQDCWNRLVDEWHRGNPLLSMEWHQLWLSHFARERLRVRYVKVMAGAMPVAYFPLLEEPGAFHHVPVRYLRFPKSPAAVPITNGAFRDAVQEYFCASVLPSLSWDVFLWNRLLGPEYLPQDSLLAAFGKCGYLAARWKDEGNWIYEGEQAGSQAYLSSLSHKTQNETRRMTKKLEAAGDFEIRIVRGSDCAPAMSDYEQVQSRSWKAPEEDPGYNRALVRVFSELGKLRLGFLLVAGRPVAAQIWLCGNGRGYFYSTVHDSEFKAYSPGIFLMWQMIRNLMDQEGVTAFDCLRGDDGYKKDWTGRRRELHNLVFFQGTMRGRALYALDQQVLPFVRSNNVLSAVKRFALRRRGGQAV